jgi:hypothetical protein
MNDHLEKASRLFVYGVVAIVLGVIAITALTPLV